MSGLLRKLFGTALCSSECEIRPLVLMSTWVLWMAMFAQKTQPINTLGFYFLVKG